MGLPPLPTLVSLLVALTLTAAVAGCGGGTTGAPLAAATATTATTPATVAPSTGSTQAAPPASASGAAPRASVHHRAPARTATQPPPRPAASAPTASAAPAPRPAAPRPRVLAVDETADLTLTRRASPAHYFQAGTVTGTYAGTMAAEARITSQGVLVSFTATLQGGTIAGHAIAVAIIDGSATPGLRGTAQITGGTGRFAGIHGSGLRVTGRAKPDGSYAHVRLAGTMTL